MASPRTGFYAVHHIGNLHARRFFEVAPDAGERFKLTNPYKSELKIFASGTVVRLNYDYRRRVRYLSFPKFQLKRQAYLR